MKLRTVTPSLTVGRAVASFSSSNAAVAQIRCIAGMTTGLGDTELGSEKLLASMDVRGWALHSQGGLGWALSRCTPGKGRVGFALCWQASHSGNVVGRPLYTTTAEKATFPNNLGTELGDPWTDSPNRLRSHVLSPEPCPVCVVAAARVPCRAQANGSGRVSLDEFTSGLSTQYFRQGGARFF